jgi:hypothetical protein
VKIRVVTPCSVVVGYQRFGGPCCLHLQGFLSTFTSSCVYSATVLRHWSPCQQYFSSDPTPRVQVILQACGVCMSHKQNLITRISNYGWLIICPRDVGYASGKTAVMLNSEHGLDLYPDIGYRRIIKIRYLWTKTVECLNMNAKSIHSKTNISFRYYQFLQDVLKKSSWF